MVKLNYTTELAKIKIDFFFFSFTFKSNCCKMQFNVRNEHIFWYFTESDAEEKENKFNRSQTKKPLCLFVNKINCKTLTKSFFLFICFILLFPFFRLIYYSGLFIVLKMNLLYLSTLVVSVILFQFLHSSFGFRFVKIKSVALFGFLFNLIFSFIPKQNFYWKKWIKLRWRDWEKDEEKKTFSNIT